VSSHGSNVSDISAGAKPKIGTPKNLGVSIL
jgi:hypothetical protein